MRGKGKKVVFLMEKSSIVVKGLEKRLQAEGYETISIAENSFVNKRCKPEQKSRSHL